MQSLTAIAQYINDVTQLLEAVPKADIRRVIDALERAWSLGQCVYIFGNGGSAATASHFANDLQSVGVLGMSLSDNTAQITRIANDMDYSEIYRKQLTVLAADDVVIGISTSGQSENVIKAIVAARELRATTIAFTGFDGGRLADSADIALISPCKTVPQCEDTHHVLMHLICSVLREEMV